MLSPRQDIGLYSSSKNRRKKAKEMHAKEEKESHIVTEVKVEDQRDPAAMVRTASVHDAHSK